MSETTDKVRLMIELDKDLYESIAGKNTDQVEPRQIVRSFQATIADAIAEGILYEEQEDLISRKALRDHWVNRILTNCRYISSGEILYSIDKAEAIKFTDIAAAPNVEDSAEALAD